MKRKYIFFLILLPLFSSCLKDDKSALFFEVKSDSKALRGQHVDIGTDNFSFKDAPATYENVHKHIFKEKCIRCHKSDNAELGVNLNQYKTVFDMSDFFSPVVVAKDPESSGVYLEVESGRMPPKKTLTGEEIAFIKRWIEEGAVEK